jgi:heme exporter protein D
LTEFFNMGGYAAFVWTSYALSAAVLIGLGVSSWRRLRQLESDLAEFEREDTP